MRRSPLLATLVALALAGPADAAAPPGSPSIRGATAADATARPGALHERWTLRLLDPRSKAMIELTTARSPDGSGFAVRVRGEDGAPVTSPPGQGRATVTQRGRRATLDATGDVVTGTVALSAVRPGPAALGMDLGPGRFNEQVVPRASLSWAMPIARATARGTLTIAGVAVGVDGWRASYEHAWGQLLLEDDAHDLWDTWIVHRGADTVVAFGINRADTMTGPGARDAMWLDVLARTGRRGTRVCRPAIQRSGWVFDFSFRGPMFATRLDARCRGVRARFAGANDDRVVDDYGGWFEAYGPAAVGGAGDGWVVHRGTPG